MLQRARAGTRGGKSRRENRAPAEKGGRAVAVGAWVICGQVAATCSVCNSLEGVYGNGKRLGREFGAGGSIEGSFGSNVLRVSVGSNMPACMVRAARDASRRW